MEQSRCLFGSLDSSSVSMNAAAGEQELLSQIQHEPAAEAMLSQAVSLSSQPSLPSLPSLAPRDLLNYSPCHHECVATLRDHSSYVSALAVVDGHSLYSASSDGRIRVWPLSDTSGRQPQEQQRDGDDGCSRATMVVAACDSSVKCLLATGSISNGLLLLSSHQDGKIMAWRTGGTRKDGTTPSLALRAVLPTCVDRLRTFLLPWSYVQVRRHRWRTWVHHVDAVTALAVSPDGALLYSASWDRSLKVWRLPGFRCVESIAPAHDDAINALAVSPDGHVYTGSADKTIKAWRRHPNPQRRSKHVLVQTMERHRSAVNALALGADGNVLYSGACDRSVVVWERRGAGSGRMEATGTLRGHAKAILCLAAAGDVVCSGSADRTVRVWRRGAESTGYTRLAVLEGHAAPVKSLALVYGRGRGLFTSWGDPEEGSSNVKFPQPPGRPVAIVWQSLACELPCDSCKQGGHRGRPRSERRQHSWSGAHESRSKNRWLRIRHGGPTGCGREFPKDRPVVVVVVVVVVATAAAIVLWFAVARWTVR